jgi:hypothetical protein
MKKIKNIKDLEYEKLKLRIKQLELEKQMDRSWKRFINNFSMNSIEAQKPVAASFNFKTGNALLNGALNYGAVFLCHKVGTIAGRTVENAAEQILNKLSQKINSLVSKRKRLQKS